MKYKIAYLPIAKDDIEQTALYISDCLHAPKAALDFLDSIHEAIHHLETFPFAYPVYQSAKLLEFEYRKIPVDHYLVFYTVAQSKGLVEIHRVVYAKKDIKNLLI